MARPVAPSTADFLALVDQLRARGARRVRWGALEVELGPAIIAPPAEEPERLTADERARREREEYEDVLFASSGGRAS